MDKGYIGEVNVSSQLYRMSLIDYKILNDVLIAVDGYTYQIDHVVISRYGIFVIETKNYSGIIEGKVKDLNWVQIIRNKKNYLFNPVIQNEKHIKALTKLLNIAEDKVFNIICMTGTALYRLDNYDNIIPKYGILNHIWTYNKVIIDNVDELYYKLLENNITDSFIRQVHINNVIYSNEKKKDITKCPLCGNYLLEKKGTYGLFIGCASYPKCKYTRNIDKEDY